MLEIQNVEILDGIKLNVVKRKTKKRQILLYDTKRRITPFLLMLKNRNNGKYEDIPHYIITKTGQVINVFNSNHYSMTFNDPKVDKQVIKIAIENLGWLKKNTITGVLNNWINEAYRGKPYIRAWRGYFFWDTYTEQQLNSLNILVNQICENHDIPYESLLSSGYIKNISKFSGIVCKSNFQTIYKDINPSFDYKIFKNE